MNSQAIFSAFAKTFLIPEKLWQRHAIVLIVFCGLTVLMTWPLTLKMSHAVIGWVGDNFYFVWLIGWFQHSLATLSNPLSVPILNYPEGWNLAYNEMTPAMVLIAMPISLVAGPVAGYNFSIFVSFVLSGFGMYLWVQRVTGRAWAGMVAGAIFAFAPYRLSHAFGHLNLMGTQWFPFFFMGLDSILRNPSWCWKEIIITAGLLGLIGLTSQYYLYMTFVLSICYIFSYVFLFHTWQDRLFWKNIFGFTIISLLFVVVSIAPYLQLSAQGNLPQRSFEEVRMWSASPLDFALPSPRHFLWGPWIDSHFDRRLWIENTLYIGVATLPLAIFAFFNQAVQPSRTNVTLWFIMGIVSFTLALGTDLHINGHSVIVDVPTLLQTWHPYERTFIPLPGYFLFKYLPFYANMRIWMRYGIFAIMFTSLLAGIGMAWLLERQKHQFARWLTGSVIIALILTDFFQGPVQLSVVQERAVDAWLANQSGDGAVAQFPFSSASAPEYTYFTLAHGKPFIGGFFAAYAPPQFQRIAPIMQGFPDRDSIVLLKELGVQWVIVDARKYQDYTAVHDTIESLGLTFRIALDEHYVYEIR